MFFVTEYLNVLEVFFNFLQFFSAAGAHEVLWSVCFEFPTPRLTAYFAGFQVWHLNHVLIRLNSVDGGMVKVFSNHVQDRLFEDKSFTVLFEQATHLYSAIYIENNLLILLIE